VANLLRRRIGEKAAYVAVRWKNVLMTMLSFELSRRRPQVMKRLLRRGLELQLPPDFDIDRHFTPRYNPWDQRLCLVPDGDLFKALSAGSASIVTDAIESFTETGIRLASGEELEADVIVTATGLNMQLLSGATVSVDGEQVNPAEQVAYKGMMLSGVPNLAFAIGYTNASWTLKCDLVCGYVCRLLRHMDEHGYDHCTPVAPAPSEPLAPIIDFQSGYVLRVLDQLPKQGVRHPWRLHQNYFRDISVFRRAPLEDEGMRFSRSAGAGASPHELARAA
jgi:cation diffusion facilitator CzcD-associated flavoprotein CzcO